MPEKDERPIGRTNAAVVGERRLIPWIWEGVVAQGAVTLLDGRRPSPRSGQLLP
jgi:hypothetical protein